MSYPDKVGEKHVLTRKQCVKPWRLQRIPCIFWSTGSVLEISEMRMKRGRGSIPNSLLFYAKGLDFTQKSLKDFKHRDLA